jgi:hypothetical protein
MGRFVIVLHPPIQVPLQPLPKPPSKKRVIVMLQNFADQLWRRGVVGLLP